MEKINNLKPVSRIIFKTFFVSVLSVLLLTGTAIFFIINKTAKESLDNSITSIQKMVVQNLSQDILSGGYNEVYRKCNNIIEDQHIYRIEIKNDLGEIICSLKKKDSIRVFSVKENKVFYDDEKTELAAIINIQYISDYQQDIFWNTLILLLLSLIGITIISFFISKKSGKNLLINFNFLNEILETYRPDKYLEKINDRPENEIQEFETLFTELSSVSTKLISYEEKLVESTRLAAVGELAAQVAHDIRSPIAALDVVMKDMSGVPEDKRLMISSASTRIHDIANNLLQKNRKLTNDNKSNQLTTVLIPTLVEGILTEKRMQFRSKIGINISSNIGESSYGLFAKIVPSECKRAISNILNNSIEALGETGQVTVELGQHDIHGVEIHIKDNGKGVPSDILSKLGQKGETHGKEEGSGLGLYHARSAVESWGGSLEIQSELHVGTTITIRLPKLSPPKPFVSGISLLPASTLVIIDDDDSVHQIWDQRLESINSEKSNIKIIHISCPEEAGEWIERNDQINVQYLVDYEFIGYEVNGLDLIEKFKLANRSLLVTSRFEENQVKGRCTSLMIGLIPKGMAGFVPFSIGKNKASNILIDDDELIHKIWTSAAEKKDESLTCYSDPDELMKNLDQIPKETIFYIDYLLGENISGEDVAKTLFESGYSNLYLATGYDPDQLEKIKFIKGVLGKKPPW